MDVQQYFQEVRDERDLAFVAIQKQTEQPRGARLDTQMCRNKNLPTGFYTGSCYIISVKNRAAQIVEGNVCEATINLAGQRIAEQTHRLASDDEIRAYKAAGKQRGEDLKRSEAILQAANRKTVVLEQAK